MDTHTHPFNGPLSGTTRVSRYQKGKTNLDFTEARDSEWQWHQPGHMQVDWVVGCWRGYLSGARCRPAPRSRPITMPAPHHSVFYRPDALPAAQPTVSKHWRQMDMINILSYPNQHKHWTHISKVASINLGTLMICNKYNDYATRILTSVEDKQLQTWQQ